VLSRIRGVVMGARVILTFEHSNASEREMYHTTEVISGGIRWRVRGTEGRCDEWEYSETTDQLSLVVRHDRRMFGNRDS
jgi:hypothetical protein